MCNDTMYNVRYTMCHGKNRDPYGIHSGTMSLTMPVDRITFDIRVTEEERRENNESVNFQADQGGQMKEDREEP